MKFVCPSCGLDSSDFVNELIRQEFGGQTCRPAAAATAAAAAAAPRACEWRMARSAAGAAARRLPAPSKFCAKHRERATEKCAVCQKPICPKCLELFGFFCSPLCKGKAEAQRSGRAGLCRSQRFGGGQILAQNGPDRRRAWAAVVLLFLGGWIWYAWFGSVPHPCFSVRFEDTDRGYSGRAQLVGQDQLVFLHGGTLARYDLKTKKPVWSQELITKQQIDDRIKAANDEQARMNEGTGCHSHRTQDDIERSVRQALQSELTLRVSGQNIWVGKADKLTHYDWDSGKVVREITLPERAGELVESGDELQMIGAQSVTHISLASGDSHVEQFGPAGAKTVVLAQNDAGRRPAGRGHGGDGKPLDPKRSRPRRRI